MEATPKKKTLNNLQFFDPQISIINLPAIFVHPHQTCFLAKPYMHISVCLFSTYARFSLSVSQRLNNHAISPITGQNPPNRTRKLHLRTRKSTESNLSHLSHLRGAQLKDLIYAFDDKGHDYIGTEILLIVISDVFSASAYGDLSKLRKFVEEDGASVVIPDGNGYYALQWASLNNFPDIAQYIIERGGDVHATDHMKQTALHWAAVRGSVAVADVLLQNGAPVEASDINGYWAVHIAAQYGQTGFLNFIVAKFHAEFDVPDNDGRSPLHWAAYKGFTDTVRLLLFRDASQERQDKEGTKW